MTVETPTEFLSRVEADAQRVETETATGRVVWHLWGAGPTVLLLHGGAGSWRHWIRNIDALSRHFRLVAPDLPGLGESELSQEPPNARAVAASVLEGLDAVIGAGTPYHVVGFSFGGSVGGEIALLRPNDALSLIIVGSSSLGLPRGQKRALVRVRHLAGAERRAAHFTNLSHQMIADTAKIDELAINILEFNASRSRLNTPMISKQNSLRDALGSLSLPINAIYGDRDSSAYPYIQERVDLFRQLQPQAKVHLCPGAGHWVQYEAADAVNDILIETLSAIETSCANGVNE